MLQASEKQNVLPTQAKATVNFRIIPGDSVQSVVDHVRTVVNGVGRLDTVVQFYLVDWLIDSVYCERVQTRV